MTQRIAFVVAPAFEMLDLSGPMCALNCALAYHGAPYELSVVSSTAGPVISCQGISIETSHAPDARQLDTVIVVGDRKRISTSVILTPSPC